MLFDPERPPFLDIAWLCEKGPVRAANEDAFLVRTRWQDLGSGRAIGTAHSYSSSDPVFLGVADGCGGGPTGCEARGVLHHVANSVLSTRVARGDDDLRAVVKSANRNLYDRRRRRPVPSGFGATLTVAVLRDRQATIAQVGDTRCYRFRDGELTQVTADQTLVAQLVREGHLTDEAARDSPYSNVVMQAIGAFPDVCVNVSTVGLQRGDWLLLCTDGVWRLVRDSVIGEICRGASSASALVSRLASVAVANGGSDNLSVIAARVNTPDDDTLADTNAVVIDVEPYPNVTERPPDAVTPE